MQNRELKCALLTCVSLLYFPGFAIAQTPPPAAPTPMKTIGAAHSVEKRELIQSLIVMNSRGATLQGDKLTMTGMAPSSIVFADRPVRLAGHEPTAMLLEDWGKGNDNFTKDPPNATISVFSKDGLSVKDAVVVLKTPKIEGDNLTFTVQLLEGDIAGADGAASLFVDIFGVWRGAPRFAAPSMPEQLALQLTPLHPTILTRGRPAATIPIRPATETMNRA